MTAFVLDNSVTMRWCFDAGRHPYADSVLRQLKAVDGVAVVPVLWRYEVSAVLARAQVKAGMTSRDAVSFLNDLDNLNIVLDMTGTERIFTAVHHLAVTLRLTAYDAAYLELAQRQALPLATLDQDLIRACNTLGLTLVPT